MNSRLRPLAMALLMLMAGTAWGDRGGGSSGGSGSSGGGSGSSGGGFARPISMPTPSAFPGNRGPGSSGGGGESSNSGSGNGNSIGSGKDLATSNRSGRDDASRRGESEDRSGSNGSARSDRSGPRGDSESAKARWQQGERLVRSQPLTYERDALGAPVLRAEIMMLLPAEAELSPLLARRGFIAVRDTQVLGRRLVVMRTPADLTLQMAVDLGRRLVPGAEVDVNHVLLGSGRAEGQPRGRPRASATPPAATAAPAAPPPAVHVGLIDELLLPGGEPATLGEVRLVGQRCAAAAPLTGHGLAVATLLARGVRDGGRRPVLHAADIGCGQGAVDAVASALQAMDAAGVPVVNLSAVGPYNRVMAGVVAAFLARGHVLVAAVGNDGPSAPPLYPAAYPGVVGVTAVDRQGQVLLDAGRGEHVAFAAPGVVELPGVDGSLRSWRGTSFAAPVVAAALALRLPALEVAAAQAAVAELARSAVHAGGPGRDRVLGHGVVGLAAPAVAGLR